MLGVAIQAVRPGSPARSDVEAEFGGNHHLLANRRERFTDKPLIRKRTVDLRRVKERDSPIHRRTDKRDHLLLVVDDSIREAHPQAPEAESRYFQLVSQFAFLHGLTCQFIGMPKAHIKLP